MNNSIDKEFEFKRFQIPNNFGEINCRSIYSHYFIKIFEEVFYLKLDRC